MPQIGRNTLILRESTCFLFSSIAPPLPSPQISPYSPNLSKKNQLSPNRLEKSAENIYLCCLKLNNKYHSSFNHKTAKRKR